MDPVRDVGVGGHSWLLFIYGMQGLCMRWLRSTDYPDHSIVEIVRIPGCILPLLVRLHSKECPDAE